MFLSLIRGVQFAEALKGGSAGLGAFFKFFLPASIVNQSISRQEVFPRPFQLASHRPSDSAHITGLNNGQ